MDAIRTTRTYKTRENAELALRKALALAGLLLEDERYLIAVAADGRFAPVLIGVRYLQFAFHGVTVVG